MLRTLRQFAPYVLLAALLAASASLIASQVIAKEYRAAAQLYLAPSSNATLSFQDVTLGQNLARSYVQLATAEVVLRPAMENVGWASELKDFREHTQVTQIRDTSIITIGFRHTNPAFAATAANAIADSFIHQSKELQSSLQGTAVSELEDQIRSITSDIQSLDTQILQLRASTSSPAPATTLRPDVQAQILQLDNNRQSKQQTLAQLLKTRDELRLSAARAENTVSLWQPATEPQEPETPRVLLNTLVGGFTGGLLALSVLLVIGYLEDRIRDIEDVREKLDVMPLGQVSLSGQPESTAGKLFVRDDPASPSAEAFRSIRTSILFSDIDNAPRIILVTSALAREGKSVISANLALAFSEAGIPTVLVDADLRRPSQHRLFRINAGVGLTDMLADPTQSASLERFRVNPNLLVIPSGPLPPNPGELLGSTRMANLVKKLAQTALRSTVVIDTSPIMPVADAVALSPHVDGVAFVVDSNTTHTRVSRRALDYLQRVHARVLGIVVNKVPSGAGYYGYYYGYYASDASDARRGQKATPRGGIS